MTNCKIETAFAVPIFPSPGCVKPVAVLSCYSLLPKESVPFVLNFVQKAVRLLWRGLDQVVTPHESVGRNLWKDVSPADLGEMAADVEMQNTFIGKKRTLSIGDGLASGDSKRLHETWLVLGHTTSFACFLMQCAAPGIHLTVLRKAQRVVVTACDTLCSHWQI